MSLELLLGKKKILSIEFNPPKSPAIVKNISELERFKDIVDTINITDSPMAKPRMNSIISAHLIKLIGEPIFNLTCRDRNTIALQSDLLAASALELSNVLTITGDPDKNNNSVYKLNVFGLIKLIQNLNEQFGTRFFIGCASEIPKLNNILPIRARLKRKYNLGVKFVITQPVFSKGSLENFLEASNDISIHKIIGIMPILSYKSAVYLNNNVKGIDIPLPIINKLEKASKEDSRLIGIDFLIKLLNEIHDLLPYIDGLHIMKLDYDIITLTKKYLED